MKKAFLVTLLLFWASFAVAQRNGVPTFSAADNFDVDSINLTNLVPSINVPVVLKSVGPINGSLRLEIPENCSVIVGGGSQGQVWSCDGLDGNNQGVNFNPIVHEMIGMLPSYTSHTAGGCTSFTINGVSGQDSVSFYPVSPVTIWDPPTTCGSQTVSGVKTIDGSGYTFGFSVGGSVVGFTSLTSSSGWTQSNSTVTDAFGNTLTDALLSGGNLTDTLGAVTSYTASTPEYNYTDTSGTTQHVSFTLGTSKSFVPLGGTNCGASGTNMSFKPITAVNYPDGTSYGFGWQTNGTGLSGLINSITLRTGGQISYTYTWNSICSAGEWGFSSLTRTTPDGAWNYTSSISSGSTTTTVKDPGQNKTVYTFGGQAGLLPTFINEIDRYQNTGTVMTPAYTLISKTTYCYNSPCVTNPTYPITIRQTDEYLGSGSTHMSQRVEDYDSYGNVTSDAVTDEITSQTITTTYVYGTYSSGTCSAITNTAVVDHPCTITTKNGATWLSESTYSYNSNGALTSSSACLTSTCTGSSALTTTYTPTTQGMYSAIQDPNGQTVNYTYGSCNSLMPTDVTTTVNSIAIDHKATWNCDAGVVTDTTDANSNEDDTTYDSMNRIHTYHDRMGDTNTTTYDYGTPTLDHVKITDNIGVVSYQYNDGLGRPTNSQVCETSGCTTLDTSSTSYAWNGVNFETKTYVPCTQTTLNTACTTVAVTVDTNPMGPYTTTDANSGTGALALNSKDWSFTAGPAVTQEHTKVVQTEVDGFGRTTSVCAIESSGGTSCGQTMGNSGILTSNVYSFATGAPKVVTTRGSQSHTTIGDAVGRTASIQTPEGGTVTYSYDSVTTTNCGTQTSAGALLKLSHSGSGNYECYLVDGLQRLTDVGNSTDTSTSPCRRFRYDSTANNIYTKPTGYPSSGNNLIGRMVEAATDDCTEQQSHMITDEWFAYDKEGRMTDMWEWSPNSGSAFRHTTVAYDADGVITSLSGIPSMTAITYTNDGEDRWNVAKQGTTTLVSGVTYDAASRATEIDIGAGTDKDNYSFDNVGNMKEYKLTVGSNNNDGVLTWSNIGSLRQLAITDGLNSNNTQTCKFGTATTAGYDDVARILDDDCGTVWAQTYSYDQYDNLTKAGSLSWNPGYSSTNNQYNLNGATYDSDGNLTLDATGGNSYAYNAYGQVSTSTGNPVSYDAFGHMVAFGSSPHQYEYLYSPMGKVGVLHSSTPFGMEIPLPGGGQLTQDSGGTLHYYHRDWIGSFRVASTIPTTGNGSLDWSRSFSPYGDPYNTGGDLNDRFAGMDEDTFTGVVYRTPTRGLGMNASRWLSPDPAHSGWNAYAYVTDPNTQTDPSGLGPDPLPGGQVTVVPFPDCRKDNPCKTDVGTMPVYDPTENNKALASELDLRQGAGQSQIGNPGVNPHGSAMFFNNFSGARVAGAGFIPWAMDTAERIVNKHGLVPNPTSEALDLDLGTTPLANMTRTSSLGEALNYSKNPLALGSNELPAVSIENAVNAGVTVSNQALTNAAYAKAAGLRIGAATDAARASAASVNPILNRTGGAVGLIVYFLFENPYQPVANGVKNPNPPPPSFLDLIPNPLGSTPFFHF